MLCYMCNLLASFISCYFVYLDVKNEVDYILYFNGGTFSIYNGLSE